jgi:hypothetical protein
MWSMLHVTRMPSFSDKNFIGLQFVIQPAMATIAKFQARVMAQKKVHKTRPSSCGLA